MALFDRLIRSAQENKQRIVLAEGTEPRTLKAAEMIIRDGVANIILIGNPDEIRAKAAELGLTHIDSATLVDPQDAEFTQKYAQLFYELRKSKGVTIDDARRKVLDPLYLGCLMIKNGDADGRINNSELVCAQ